MAGRDPDEEHRVSSPLELLFDLTFAVAYGIAADQLAHYLAEGHVVTSLLGFTFAALSITWAWINFSWFASAYDTDDWIFRLLTLLQMVGVLLLALGIAEVFASIDAGGHVHNGVMVGGYVVMRVAAVAQWLRAARQDPERRGVARRYVGTILVAQAGWVALAAVAPTVYPMMAGATVLVVVEFLGPLLAERQGQGTPWHPHHIAERYGLLVIIALGESLIGTISAIGAIVGPEGPGWSLEAAAVGVGGVGLAFGMWWSYFVLPSGAALAARRDRAFGWGYGHLPVYAAIVAAGAGQDVAALSIEGTASLSTFETVLATAIPVTIYVSCVAGLSWYLAGRVDPLHGTLTIASLGVLACGLGLAAAGVAFSWCLLALALSPWVTVVGFELSGHRRQAELYARAD